MIDFVLWSWPSYSFSVDPIVHVLFLTPSLLSLLLSPTCPPFFPSLPTSVAQPTMALSSAVHVEDLMMGKCSLFSIVHPSFYFSVDCPPSIPLQFLFYDPLSSTSTLYPTHVSEPILPTQQSSVFDAPSSFHLVASQTDPSPPHLHFIFYNHLATFSSSSHHVAASSFPTTPSVSLHVHTLGMYFSLSRAPFLIFVFSVNDPPSHLPPLSPTLHGHPSHPMVQPQTVLPLARCPFRDPCNPVSFGCMNLTCSLCGAKHWLDERSSGTLSSPSFSRCCHNEHAILDLLPNPPKRLQALFLPHDDRAPHFHNNIRQFNTALAFTSYTDDPQNGNVNAQGRGPWIWKTGYMLYHSISGLLTPHWQQPRYGQLYFHDPQDALNFQMNQNPNLHPNLMLLLRNLIGNINRFACLYFHAYEVIHDNPTRDLAICIISDPVMDHHHYNQPSVDEVAAIIPGDDTHVVQP